MAKRRCSICRQTGHDARAHRDLAQVVEAGIDQLLDGDGPCEEDGGDCPVGWALLCRFCRRRICVQHAQAHGCAEGWIAHRLERGGPTTVVIVEDEE